VTYYYTQRQRGAEPQEESSHGGVVVPQHALPLRASSETRAEVVELITQLEARNPTPAPTEALTLPQRQVDPRVHLIFHSYSHYWGLVVCLSLSRWKKYHKLLILRTSRFRIASSFSGPLATTSVSTNAKFEVRSPKRVQIKFDEGIIGTPQLTDSIVLPEKFELFGQNIDLTPIEGHIFHQLKMQHPQLLEPSLVNLH
ncbi:hypothetical protein EE612_046174, partial [Oryza sativa]